MQKEKLAVKRWLSSAPDIRLMLVFALEGLLFQFAAAVRNFGNNLFATNLGATDTQIGLIQTIGCAVTLVLLLPAGIFADTRKSAKTVPIILLLLGGITFILQSLVPMMGASRLILFFVFVGLSSGLFGTYNGQWQSMFGDIVEINKRNRIYALRNRVMAGVGVIVPVIVGVFMTANPNSKLNVLSVFFFLSGVLMLAQAYVVYRIPGGRRTIAQMNAAEHFSLKTMGEAVRGAVRNKPFLLFVCSSMLYYLSWHFNWSMWYIGQTQYIKMSEAQLSFCTAMCCIGQILFLGFHARLNQKKTVHFTICIGMLSLPFFPLVMIACVWIPEPFRQWIFMLLCMVLNTIECGIAMCLVQMLLEVVPERHRSLIVSLYTVLVTVSNSIMPLMGVKLYTALGADLTGFRIFFGIDCVWRIAVLFHFCMRYRRMKKSGRLAVPAIAPEKLTQ